MTRADIISYMRKNPGIKVTHALFTEYEYLYMKDDECVYDESDYLFENWNPLDQAHCGMRMRTGEQWENGWSVYNEKNDIHTSIINVCKDFRLNEKLDREDYITYII